MRISLTTAALACWAAACSGSSGRSTTTGATGGPALFGPGQQCASNQECASGVCGLEGTGNCCAQTCSTGDPTCGASGCNATGACSYPSFSCASACSDAILTISSCNGSGACKTVSTDSCPDHLSCSDGGPDAGCNTGCSSSADCATGFACNANACVKPVEIGACTENDDCTSSHCGIAGTGHCCSATCPSTTSACGATDCGADSGACMYPDSATACGSVLQSCSEGTQTNPTRCDGLGNCLTPQPIDCAPYVCDEKAGVCLASCDSHDAGCVAGDFCEMSSMTCCGVLGAGDTLAVDAKLGNDLAICCGQKGNPPCRTIAHALQLIDAAGAQDVRLLATVADAGGDWALSGETFPIVLGWGAELNAPGVYFSDNPSGASGIDGGIFIIGFVSSNDHIGYASIVGAPGNPVGIGMDREGDQSQDLTVIGVQAGNTLYFANANLNDTPVPSTSAGVAIDVAPGATLVLGGDKASAVTGTVTIGTLPGTSGILCETDGTVGCTIRDIPLEGVSSVVIEQQAFFDIWANDYAVISLSSAPVIGVAPADAGFQTCPSKMDEDAVRLNGTAAMTFENGKIQCIDGFGFDLEPSDYGSPSLVVNGTTIQNTSFAIDAWEGTATISSSTIKYNARGVDQEFNSIIDLSGGGSDGGMNTVVCSSGIEGGEPIYYPGISVFNHSFQTLNASNVSWDTPGPDLFLWNQVQGPSYTCEIASCAVDAGGDSMDAVYSVQTGGTIIMTGNHLSSIDCSLGK